MKRSHRKNWWEWVFVTTVAVLHVIKPSRGKALVTALFGEFRPEVWVSDMLSSQKGHGVEWRVCLAHYADFPVMPTNAREPATEAAIAAPGPA
jgi:transposase IS66 family protein